MPSSMPNDELLEAIRSRRQKATEFGYGILTADQHVMNVLDALGLDKCYRYAATRTTSWNDVVTKAARTLVYSNPDMVIEEIEYLKRAGQPALRQLEDVELPKNTLMVFRHVLTTPRKDRDGDVLRTQGAAVDPKMLLLWQHVHTLPIGKMLSVVEHNSKQLSLLSCIIDMNDLCHDAAVMVDNGMGRFSHGFRALEFSKIKARDGEESGFDVSKFEIMEESLVSVPSNVDSDTEEVILSLVEGGKLTSPIMKEFGRAIRGKQPTCITLPVDLKITLNGQEISSEQPVQKAQADDQAGTPTETDEKTRKEEVGATDEEVKCPECGEMMSKDEKVCPECGYEMGDEEEKPEEEKTAVGTKYGRTLSSKTLGTLKEVASDIDEIHNGDHILSAKGRDICKRCRGKLKSLIAEHEVAAAEEPKTGPLLEEAMAVVIAEASEVQRGTMLKALTAMAEVELENTKARQYRELIGLGEKHAQHDQSTHGHGGGAGSAPDTGGVWW